MNFFFAANSNSSTRFTAFSGASLNQSRASSGKWHTCGGSRSRPRRFPRLQVLRGRRIARHDGAFAVQVRLVEQLKELARLVDAACDEHGVAPAALQPVARLHIEQDVGGDLFQPVLATQHFCIVPQRFLSCALARLVNPLVLASNHWSIFACDVIRWSMSRASYRKSSTTLSFTASSNL